MTELFQRDRSLVGKHVRNDLRKRIGGEFRVSETCYSAADDKDYNVNYYDLDVISSAGYIE